MQRKYDNLTYFVLLLLIVPGVSGVRSQNQYFRGNGNSGGSNHTGCAYLECKNDAVCVHRKFRCKDPPCPGMLYCANSRTESLRGPSTCDTVHCSHGYMCILKVGRCHWDERCKQQIARCVSRKEYHEGPASCAGFKCPQGNHCILRESFCVTPPCKLLRSCGKNKEVQVWFGKCRSLGCPSEFQCFLRRPENTCLNPPCKHTPDCVTTKDEEMTNEHCRGWICPRMQKCSAEVTGSCETDDCRIRRACYELETAATNDTTSSFSRRSLQNTVPSNDFKEATETVNSVLREQNSTKTIEQFVASDKISLSPYIISDTDHLNHREETTQSPFFTHALNYPLYREEADNLPSQLSNVRNTYGQAYYTFPMGNVEEPVNSQLDDHDSDSRYNLENRQQITLRNEQAYDAQGDSFFFTAPDNLKNVWISKDESLPLWTGPIEHFQERSLPERNKLFEEKESVDRNQYFDNVSAELLKQFIEFLRLSSIANAWQMSDERSAEERAAFTHRNTINTVEESSVDDISIRNNYTNHFQPNIKEFSFEKFGNTEILDQSSLLHRTVSIPVSNISSNGNNETTDFSLLFGHDFKEKDSRTFGLILEDEEPAIRSFHDIPSYGTSDNGDFVVRYDVYESDGNSDLEKNLTKRV